MRRKQLHTYIDKLHTQQTDIHKHMHARSCAYVPTGSTHLRVLTNVSAAVTTAPAPNNNFYNEDSPNKGNKNVEQQQQQQQQLNQCQDERERRRRRRRRHSNARLDGCCAIIDARRRSCEH